MIVEHVRNVLGYRDADHEETAPDASRLVITALSCSLVGQAHEVELVEGSLARSLFGTSSTIEDYYCNYGVNRTYIPSLEDSGLFVGGVDSEVEVRLVERRDHPFFVGTLFVPQTGSTRELPHPVVKGFVAATATNR
jgi:CTP synthase (UTP-ammonia lyase)